MNSRVARILTVMTFPGHLLMKVIIVSLSPDPSTTRERRDS
jgi:hypothetical protein